MRLQPIFDIAELCASKGVANVVLCPGSRCAPLVLGFVNHPGITARTISDERSAGFIALGIAQQTQQAVALVCTSGTAAYNFAPAVAEARYQHIPLLVFTADRPMEWTGQWDGQTIEQQSIYGGHAKRFYQLPQDYDHADARWSIIRQLNEGINLARSGRKGPVHFNVPLREPLYPAAGETISFTPGLRVIEQIQPVAGLPAKLMQALAQKFDAAEKVLIVGGHADHDLHLIETLHAFSRAHAVPIVGEVISNLHPLPAVIRRSDAILSSAVAETKRALQPDLLITFGKSLLTRNLKQFLRDATPGEHWHLAEDADEVIDPFHGLTTNIESPAEEFFTALGKAARRNPARSRYFDAWHDEEARVEKLHADYFAANREGEFACVQQVLQHLPDHTTLHLANSMAVRYANLVSLSEEKKGVRVFSNRGTSGIDGCTSTAVGHVLQATDMNVLITGDMAFFYDRNAFWHNYALPDLRIIIINNGGGAIFGMIDGPSGRPEAGEYFITKQKLNAGSLASEYGFGYRRLDNLDDAEAVLADFFTRDGGPRILEFMSDSSTARRQFLEYKDYLRSR